MNHSPYSIVFLPYNSYTPTQNYGIQQYNHWGYKNQQQLFQNQAFNNGFPQIISDPRIYQCFSFQPSYQQINIQTSFSSKSQENCKLIEKNFTMRRIHSQQNSQKASGKKQKDKKKYIQNPKRNVITNLGNQLLALLGNKYKLNEILRKFPQKFDEQLVSSFLIYVNQVRKAQNSYLSVKKMRNMWYSCDVNQHLEQVLKLFRKVSYFYLSNLSHLQLIKSIKMRQQTKMHHLRGIKSLICVLRNSEYLGYSFKQEQ